MKLDTLCIIVLMVGIVKPMYILHPNYPDILIPVTVDKTRPKVRLQQVFVEDPPNENRLCEYILCIHLRKTENVPSIHSKRYNKEQIERTFQISVVIKHVLDDN